jgi:hypothetical protein
VHKVRLVALATALVATSIGAFATSMSFKHGEVLVVAKHINLAKDLADKWLVSPEDASLGAGIYEQCADAMDIIADDDWVLQCGNLAEEGKRCESRVGLMSVCEGGDCLSAGCFTSSNCESFAAFIGAFDSCRTYSCLNNRCVDQAGVNGSPNSTTLAGASCTSTQVADGLCDDRGDCKVFFCGSTADCPGYALECSTIACQLPDGICAPEHLPTGTPCSIGHCMNGVCL